MATKQLLYFRPIFRVHFLLMTIKIIQSDLNAHYIYTNHVVLIISRTTV